MSHLNASLLLRGKQTAELEIPPLVRFSYKFNQPFNTMAMAYLKKFNWEKRTQLSTIAHVEQPDDDTLIYYRRQERITTNIPAWEKVTINRSDNTMVCEALGLNTDGSTGVIQRDIFTSGDSSTQNEQQVYGAVDKSYTVEQFKASVALLSKVIKFNQFEQE